MLACIPNGVILRCCRRSTYLPPDTVLSGIGLRDNCAIRRDTAMKRKVYNAVYERMLRYVVENPPPDATEERRVGQSSCQVLCT